VTLLCEPNGLVAASLLVHLGPEVAAVATLTDAANALNARPNEREVIFGPGLVFDDVLQFVTWLHSRQVEGWALILMRANITAEDVERAAAAGIAAVVPADDPAALIGARGTLGAEELVPDEVDVEQATLGEIITVFSAKGGCGKTTLATNLAVTLAAGESTRVCLVDLDLDFGDIAISLRLTPERTLLDAAEVQSRDEVGPSLELLTTSYSGGFDCVLAPAEPGDGDRVSAALVGRLLEHLRAHYDYVVVDTPSHFSEHVLAALDRTDYYVLVTTPEIPSLKNLRLTLDMFDLLSYGRDKRLIVFNRSDDQTGLTAADVEKTVKAPIAAHIPSSRDVPISINKGVPIAQSHPKHPVSDAIRKFVSAFITQQALQTGGRLFSRRKPVRN
jgi:pilus assembly protein CpaE